MAEVSRIRKGMRVKDVDGLLLGTVTQRGTGRSLICEGTVVRQLYVVDDDSIERVADEEVQLKVTRAFVLEQHVRQDDEVPYLAVEPPAANPPAVKVAEADSMSAKQSDEDAVVRDWLPDEDV